MLLLAWYLGVVVVGYFVGGLIRKKSDNKLPWIGKVQTVVMILLLLVMGIRLGANEEVVKGLGSIGIVGFVTAIFAMAGSVLAVIFARKLMKIDRKGEKND